MESRKPSQLIATVVDDMFFAAKIRAAAENAGRTVKALKSHEQLVACLREESPALVIVDLNSSRLDPLEVIRLVKSNPQTASVPVVAFVSHVETEMMREAQQAGCDRVLPRSSFSQLLPSIVK